MRRIEALDSIAGHLLDAGARYVALCEYAGECEALAALEPDEAVADEMRREALAARLLALGIGSERCR